MNRKRRRFGGIFWQLVASYSLMTLVVAFIGNYIGRFDGPFGVFRGSPIVRFFNRLGDNSTNSILLVILIASIAVSLTGLLISTNLTRRLARIAEAAEAWSRGEFTAVARVPGNDELGQLARDLNHMAEQIQALFVAQQSLAVLEERNRLARELHDSVKQHVFANALLIRASRKLFASDPQKALVSLAEAEELAGQVQQELAEMIRALRPAALADKGLAAAIQEFTNEWSRRMGIDVEVRVEGERTTPLDIEEALFRVTQEALANIARHSEAKHVEIQLAWIREKLLLTIRDNGKGFDIARVERKGLGLRHMRERVEMLDGTLTISSSADGTSVTINIPISRESLHNDSEAIDG
jgi:signal transduction histidine kinase